jgi:hypothetical protein
MPLIAVPPETAATAHLINERREVSTIRSFTGEDFFLNERLIREVKNRRPEKMRIKIEAPAKINTKS